MNPQEPKRSWHEPKSADAVRIGLAHFAGQSGASREEGRARLDLEAPDLDDKLDAARTKGDRQSEAHFLRLLGVRHLRAGRFDWAIEAFSESVDSANAAQDEQGVRVAESHLAIALARGGEAVAAEALLRKLCTTEISQDPLEKAIPEVNLGILLAHRQRLASALDTFDAGFSAARAADADPLKAITLNNAGVITLLEGHYAEAIGLLERSALVAQRISERAGLARAYNNIGASRFESGHLFEAIPYFEMALSLVEESHDHPMIIEILNNNVVAFEHQYLEPARAFREALRQARAAVTDDQAASRMRDAATIDVPQLAGRDRGSPSEGADDVFPSRRALFWFAEGVI